MKNWQKALAIAMGWAALMAVAVLLDVPLSRWAHASGLSEALKTHWSWAARTMRVFGNFLTYTAPAAVLLFVLRRRRDAVFVALAGVFSGLNSPIKWLVGRHRPYHGFGVFEFHPCQGPVEGLMGMTSGLSFPSGDVALAAATSTALAILFPRWRWAAISVVLLVAAERIAEGAHYPSDTVGGALLGWAVALAARRIVAALGEKT